VDHPRRNAAFRTGRRSIRGVSAEADLVLPHFPCCGSSFRGRMST
jgi:hypothetical protein